MAKLMLIGGGEVGRGNTEYETGKIDEEVVKMTDKVQPNFLFIGLASSFSDSYYDTMKKIYRDLGCTCVYLKKKNILNNPNIVKEKIENADIIYLGGGDTIKLVQDLKEYKIDVLLKEAYDNNKVLVGISAGAIALSRDGYSDAYKLRGESDSYDFVEGLGFVDISFCPHYEKDSERRIDLIEDLKVQNKEVFALENNTALKVIDQEYTVIRSQDNKKAYLCKLKDNLLDEISLECGRL